MDIPLETPNPSWSFPFYLDVGIYWYSYGNETIRHVPGESNPFFTPGAPTVLYVHGWQKATTVRGFRETFSWAANVPGYGLDVDTAAAWLDDGWNVGIFYWNQYADEPSFKDAEAKIWSAKTRVKMRWRQLVVEMDGNVPMRKVHLAESPEPTPSVAQIFCQAYLSLFATSGPRPTPTPTPTPGAAVEDGGDSASASASAGDDTLRPVEGIMGPDGGGPQQCRVRLIGHSLGAQIVLAATYELYHKARSEAIPSWIPLPNRVSLVDVLFSSGKKDYLGRRSIGSTLCRQIDALARTSVAVEQIKVSRVAEVLASSSERIKRLRQRTAFVTRRPDPASIPKHAMTQRHASGPWLYFYSYARTTPALGSSSAHDSAPSATSDSIDDPSRPSPSPTPSSSSSHPSSSLPPSSSSSSSSSRSPRLKEVVERRRGLLGKKHDVIGQWVYLAQRSDADIRDMMQSMYVWKQISTHTFLRTSRTTGQ